jgi:sugar-specific transcriptional regulator TrmB
MSEVLNGKLVVEKLGDFGLSEYESRVYFVLLTLGESRVGNVAKKAYVPQSKMYEVLERLVDKDFIEQTTKQRPVIYCAYLLGNVFVFFNHLSQSANRLSLRDKRL